MNLQTNFRSFSQSAEVSATGLLQSSLNEVYFGTTLLFQEKEGTAAPGGGTQAAPDTVPGDTSSTASVSTGGYIQGTIDTPGDHDWYRITLFAGNTYTFSTIFSLDLVDTVLQLRDSNGNLIAESDDANFDNGIYLSEITFTATSFGYYYLDVSEFGSLTGDFILSVSMPINSDIAGTVATTASLAIGASTSSTFGLSGDHDWYAVQLVAGQTYLFTTESTGGFLSDPDTALYLRDASGNLLAFNDDSYGTYSRIRFTATETGTYYIDVGGWAESESGDYKVKAEIAGPLTVYTYDQIAYHLTNTYWGGTQQRFNVQTGGTLTVNVTALTADGQFLAREALKLWSDVTGITFNEVSLGGQIQFDDNEPGASSISSLTGGFIVDSQVNVSVDWLVTSGTGLDSYSFQTYVHEIGHALGLGHAGPYNITANYARDAVFLNDAWVVTVMSYFDPQQNTYFNAQGFSNLLAQTPMIADILAINTLYGTPTNLRIGDTTYGFNNNSGRAIYDAAVGQSLIAVTVVDHGGNDTLDYSGYSSNQRINLNPETFSNTGGGTGNLSIARGTIIENAKGGNGSDVLIGNAFANVLTGGSNIDTAVASGNRAAYTVTQTSTGVFQVVGPDGTDTLLGVEFLQFADELLRLLPGTGTTVDFNTDPDTYMGAIRDFDGNNLGAGDGWLRIGAADVDGDGDLDQIFVNRTIGRFAEVATGPDGKVYFADHGWAGETRVVGTYIDPLVQSGQVQAGGPNDSQRRFQNDLRIENINGVLGAADYDRDGLQEVYFRLTDGTAYLHAYMHADGNIRYANYQSQQQVIEFLTNNGWAASTYAGWFPSGAEEPRVPKAAAVTETQSLELGALSYTDYSAGGWMAEYQATMAVL